jgi:hypothetical protein
MRLFCLLIAVLPLTLAAKPASTEVGGSSLASFDEAHLSDSTGTAEVAGSLEKTWVLAGGSRGGKSFTKKGRALVKEKNAAQNEGKNRCENCGVETVPGKKHEAGVTPPANEAHVDHVIPKVKGGPGEPDNGQV